MLAFSSNYLQIWTNERITLGTRLHWPTEQRQFLLLLYRRKSQAGCCQGQALCVWSDGKIATANLVFQGFSCCNLFLLYILLRILKQLWKSWVLPVKPEPKNDVPGKPKAIILLYYPAIGFNMVLNVACHCYDIHLFYIYVVHSCC